jgi:trimethylamine--corrinoid protein Co-methyltransferase
VEAIAMHVDFQMLDPKDAEQIHQAAIQVVSQVGMVLEDEELFQFMQRQRIPADETSRVVRFPRQVVEQALASAPRQVSLWSHQGDELPLQLGHLHPSTYSNALNVLDYAADAPRSSTLDDLVRLVRLGDALSEIKIVGPVCWAQDMPPLVQDLHSAAATITNSAKHANVAPQDLKEAQIWADLATIADQDLDPHPGSTLSFVTSSTSPLQLDGNTAQVLRYGAERSIPLILAPCPIAGAASPFTIAGTLVQAHAENLWLLTLAQLINEGTPVILGGAAGPMDMRSGNLSYGCPERHLMLGASIELARFYGLPHHSPAGTVDAGSPDVQSGAEKMRTWVMRLLNGITLGIGVGSLLTGSTVSLEQMVIDVDLLQLAQRVLRGFRVDEETLAVDAIARVGPGGDFMMDKHTLRAMRSDEYYLSPLANREGRLGQTMLDRAHERVEALLAAHTPPVSPSVVAEVESYVKEREQSLG